MAAVLPLLPPFGLDNSILVAVLVGLIVLTFFTEAFGWVFAGLVVPGYLASVFVIQPEAGATIVFEAVVTYGVCALLSRVLSRTGAWTDFFGRERFFIIVLVSVLVREVDELWLLPMAAERLDAALGTAFAAQRTFFSIGLVLVPLTANAFWKLRLARGLFQVGVPVAITYAIVAFVLLPYTNLSFSSFALTYEDVALHFLASPKSYIILLTAAWLGARYNLRYGWDFNGVLVPALVALTWFDPPKLLATVGEVLVLVLAANAVMRLPGLRMLNLEGPRKTILVFVVGFLVKYLIGWSLGGRIPGLKVTDLFGFGYLVPTLVAVKILQKKTIARVLFPTLQTSLTGVAVGSLIGFALHLVEPNRVANADDRHETAPKLASSPLASMGIARVKARHGGSRQSPLTHDPSELLRYGELWRGLAAWIDSGEMVPPAALVAVAGDLGLSLAELPERPEGRRAWLLVEREEHLARLRGWDTAAFFPGAKGPVLEVPRPWSEAPSAETAALLCERVDCPILLASGVDSRFEGLTVGDAVTHASTSFQVAQLRLEGFTVVQVRADDRVPVGAPIIHVSEGLPPSLDPHALWTGEASLSWQDPPEPPRDWRKQKLVVLRAHPRALVAALAATAPEVPVVEGRTLVNRLVEEETPEAVEAEPLTELELRFYEELVVAQLARAMEPGRRTPEQADADVRWAARMAAFVHGEITTHADCVGKGSACWIAGPAVPGGALPLLAFRSGHAAIGLGVPVSGTSQGTTRLAAELFQSLDARVLLSAPRARMGPASSVASPFHAAHQALHRSLSREEGGVLLQLRSFAPRADVDSDVILSVGRPMTGLGTAPMAVRRLFEAGGGLVELAPATRVHDGAMAMAGLLEVGPEVTFSNTMGGAQAAVLWISDRARGLYGSPAKERALAPFRAVGWTVEEAEIVGSLAGPSTAAARCAASAQGCGEFPTRAFEQVAALAEKFQAQRNINDLRRLKRLAESTPGMRVAARWCPSREVPYLLVESRAGSGALKGVFFLDEPLTDQARLVLDGGSAALAAKVSAAVVARRRVVVHVGEGT